MKQPANGSRKRARSRGTSHSRSRPPPGPPQPPGWRGPGIQEPETTVGPRRPVSQRRATARSSPATKPVLEKSQIELRRGQDDQWDERGDSRRGRPGTGMPGRPQLRAKTATTVHGGSGGRSPATQRPQASTVSSRSSLDSGTRWRRALPDPASGPTRTAADQQETALRNQQSRQRDCPSASAHTNPGHLALRGMCSRLSAGRASKGITPALGLARGVARKHPEPRPALEQQQSDSRPRDRAEVPWIGVALRWGNFVTDFAGSSARFPVGLPLFVLA